MSVEYEYDVRKEGRKTETDLVHVQVGGDKVFAKDFFKYVAFCKPLPRLVPGQGHPTGDPQCPPSLFSHLCSALSLDSRSTRSSTIAHVEDGTVADTTCADANDAGEGEVRVSSSVNALDLEITGCAGKSVAEADGSFAVVGAPADVSSAGPDAVGHAGVGKAGGESEEGEGGEVGEDGG